MPLEHSRVHINGMMQVWGLVDHFVMVPTKDHRVNGIKAFRFSHVCMAKWSEDCMPRCNTIQYSAYVMYYCYISPLCDEQIQVYLQWTLCGLGTWQDRYMQRRSSHVIICCNTQRSIIEALLSIAQVVNCARSSIRQSIMCSTTSLIRILHNQL